MNSLSLEQPKLDPSCDAYTKIEAASSKLSDTDKNDLLGDKEYQTLVGRLNQYIQAEQFRQIRSNLNQNKDAVCVMNELADYIEGFKQRNDNKKAEVMKTFEDYITNYPDMSYSEYLKSKGK